MPSSDFSEIKIVNDDADRKEIIRGIIKSNNQEDAFHLLDIGEVITRNKLWLRKMPRVTPYFAVKSNPDPTVIKILAKLNGNFDCASKNEITYVMKHGVSGERIIFANPMKAPSQIEFAKNVGVDKLTADCEHELFKIKDLFPEAKIIIRFRCDSENADINLGLKYGCDPKHEAIKLIHLTKSLGLTLYGFSFHVGSPCGDLAAYAQGIRIAEKLIGYAKSVGCYEANLIDIGGGFPGESDYDFNQVSQTINNAIEHIDPSIKIISEPGRYYVTAAFTAVAHLFGKKTIIQDNEETRMYYVNDGTFGSFIEELLDMKTRCPTSLNGIASDGEYLSTLWGPTCDSLDCIVKKKLLPDFEVGDWLIWGDMGAYTSSCASKFNGFQPPAVFPFMRNRDLIALKAELIRLKNENAEE